MRGCAGSDGSWPLPTPPRRNTGAGISRKNAVSAVVNHILLIDLDGHVRRPPASAPLAIAPEGERADFLCKRRPDGSRIRTVHPPT